MPVHADAQQRVVYAVLGKAAPEHFQPGRAILALLFPVDYRKVVVHGALVGHIQLQVPVLVVRDGIMALEGASVREFVHDVGAAVVNDVGGHRVRDKHIALGWGRCARAAVFQIVQCTEKHRGDYPYGKAERTVAASPDR